MPSSHQGSPPHTKRPSMTTRTSSASSAATLLQSPTETPHQHRSHKAQKHVRLGQRNLSFGKNLNKLGKQAVAHAAESAVTKGHRRVLSGGSTPTESQRPNVRRNASTVGIVRHTTQAPIRKNHSSGHLPRNSSSKNMLKPSKSEVAPAKRSLMKPGRSRPASREADHPTVHFDIGDDPDLADDTQEDAWTEESASQSPNTTRSNTRSNSVILDPHATQKEEGFTSPTTGSRKQSQQGLAQATRKVVDAQQINGASSYTPSRPPDADMITSRLLRRTASNTAKVETSLASASATGLSDSHDARTLSQSQGSTLAETPGRDLVSRFMDGDGSVGTPRNSNFLTPAEDAEHSQEAEHHAPRRNKSQPNMAHRHTRETTPTSTMSSRATSRRSGTNTPSSDLNPSRTQQKLWLQRASSNVEPQKLIPVILPRTGGPQLLTAGVNFSTGYSEGRVDPRLLKLFENIAKEYTVVHRYRNPLADALGRLDKLPTATKKNLTSTSSARSRMNGRTERDEMEEEGDGRRSFESDGGTVRSEAEEICRRMWESTEVVEED
ncbi:hypothetical protein EJ05DRAFT_279319 [Pseudovirgaria hyperparasitica]|uniref:Uncharacterized protein n=1 Tax=Pseudovirgaria hyperparasitica TaxID=470096 RepID=A0A6A6WDQ2_9PEZI|nr:uncharacterized protein EJ05DRAFT_279319 [Pseudovirgaria hyperparasitica]KAF2760309.1 hypothetical protein EJ05DRAFT_279319 [Pseudovirgaria hyperparasitica]